MIFDHHLNCGYQIICYPFGYYEIVRAVPKAPNEVICGDNNYFVKDPQENYYYFQVFHRNSMEERDNELGARGVLTGNKIKEDKGRKSYVQISISGYD